MDDLVYYGADPEVGLTITGSAPLKMSPLALAVLYGNYRGADAIIREVLHQKIQSTLVLVLLPFFSCHASK